MSMVQQQLEAAIAALESQRALLGDAVADAALDPLRSKLASLAAPEVARQPAQTLRQVSILFLDVVGSTALSRGLDPEEVHAVMDGALARCTLIVQNNGGRVLKYAGDSLLAVFGADETREDDAENAVRCGLELLAEGLELGRQVQATHGHAGFDVRVGVHTGPVLLGGGVDAEASIRGSAVNIAARMEQTALPGSLRISVDTQRLVQGLFDVAEQPALEVKGIALPMQTFLVLGARARQPRGLRHALESVAAPLIGRATEVGQLQAMVDAVVAGSGLRTATVLGEAGMGKSRLLAEFRDGLVPTLRTDALWLASCHPQSLHQPCGLLRDLFFWHIGVADSDTQAQAQERFAAALRPVLGAQAQEHIALLGQMIGLDYGSDAHVAGILQDARQLRARGLHAFVAALQHFSMRQPLVLVFDDLQWADDESLDTIDYLVRAGAVLPITLVCAARLELLQRRPDWGSTWPGHQRIELSPLAGDASDALAQVLTARLDPPSLVLRALLTAQGAGNPYYMEALLQMLIDTGVIGVDGDRWQVHDDRLQALQVPPTLVGVLQATLDSLAPGDRRSLQEASIVGAQFWDEALAAIDPQALSSLPTLALRRLTLPQEHSAFEGAREYAFRHYLLHQVTYGTVLRRDKREGHTRAARWLQGRSTGREAEVASQVAEHYERAGERAEALSFWMRAAQDASRRESDAAALAHTERALALDDGSDLYRLSALHRVRCGAYMRQGRVDEHLNTIATLEALAETLDDGGLRLIAGRDRVWRLSNAGQNAEAVARGEHLLALATEAPPTDQARMHIAMFIALSRQGRLDDAMAHGEAALKKAKRAGNRLVEADILNNIGVNHQMAHRHLVAEDCFQQALRLYASTGSRYGAVIAHVNLALIAEQLGRFEQSRDMLQRVLQVCGEIGHRGMEARAFANLAGLCCELDDAQAGWKWALQGVRQGCAVADRSVQATAHGAAFKAALTLGLPNEALEHARAGTAAYLDIGQPEEAWACRAGAAYALYAAGDKGQAMSEIDALLVEVSGRTEWNEALDAQGLLYQLLAAMGDARAHAMLQMAHRALTHLADVHAEVIPRERFMRATVWRRELSDAWELVRSR